MPQPDLDLSLLSDSYAICRLDRDEEIPTWALSGEFVSITRTAEELSVICPQRCAPEGLRSEGGWRVLKVEGPLSLDLIGVLASLAVPLEQASIPIAAVSTYDTNYLLVRNDDLERALDVLSHAGHRVSL